MMPIDVKQTGDAHLANTLTEVLIEIRSYLTELRDAANLSESCYRLSQLFQPNLKAVAWAHLKLLLQAVIDDDRIKVKEILEKYPKLLFCDPKKIISYEVLQEGIESQKTWQRLIPEHPLVMAIKRKQVKMVELLLLYFKKLENGAQEALVQWKNAEADLIEQGGELRKSFDFASLIDVVAQEKFPNGTGLEDRLSEKTEEALVQFRQTVLPDEAVALSKYYDIEQLLIAAYEAYSEGFRIFQNWAQREVFCINVIGFIQSLLSPEDAKVFCEGLYDVVENHQEIGPRAASLKLVGGQSYYRVDRSFRGVLGFEYLAYERGCEWWGGLPSRLIEGMGPGLADYVDLKQQTLDSLRSRCHKDMSQLLHQ